MGMELALAVGSYTWLMARVRRLAQELAPELALSAPQNLQRQKLEMFEKCKESYQKITCLARFCVCLRLEHCSL
jgi:hypothetical protein